ncbi:MAG: DUF695 domain-containing protein [Myxococcaceae bacterium]
MHATFCQLCGVPVQHDHYVPSFGGMLRIYRASREGGGHDWAQEPSQPFPFDDRHAWLLDAVGVRTLGDTGVVRGAVEDGGLTTEDGEEIYVSDGNEDAMVFHAWCWEAIGKPERSDDALHGGGLLPWAQLEPWREQLFDFAGFLAAGCGAWLEDPARSEASRSRIERHLAAAKSAATRWEEPQSIDDVFRLGRDWRGTQARNRAGDVIHHVRYRLAPTPRMDLSERPSLLTFMRTYAHDGLPAPALVPTLHQLELDFQQALERDRLGLCVVHSVGEGKAQFLAYVKDLAEAQKRADALDWSKVPGVTEYDNTPDPAWKIYFEEMGLPSRT